MLQICYVPQLLLQKRSMPVCLCVCVSVSSANVSDCLTSWLLVIRAKIYVTFKLFVWQRTTAWNKQKESGLLNTTLTIIFLDHRNPRRHWSMQYASVILLSIFALH